MKIVQQINGKLNNRRNSIDVDTILKQIENYDIVSFDIFDTLLKRNINKPTDIFAYVEKKHNQVGYCNNRINAEK